MEEQKTSSFPWKRIAFDIILLGTLVLFPWWVSFALSIIGIVFFKYYLEAIVAGIILDSAFGMTGNPWTWFWHTLMFGGTFLILTLARVKIHPFT